LSPGLDEVNAAIPVSDVMSSPVITVSESDSIEVVSKVMDKHNLGSIVVIDDKGHPVGIITERDIVMRVAAKNLSARDVTANSVMSSPLVTIEPRADIKKAAGVMRRKNISRVIVINDGEMVGIISKTDIIAITPALIDIITEKVKITSGQLPLKEFYTTGYCERCRQWSTSLKWVDNKFICEECRVERDEEV